MSRREQRLDVTIDGVFAIVSLNDMEIWDGADLCLLREALTALIERDGFRAIGVQLSGVKYLPSGFFGMLFEWYEQGIKIRLDNPFLDIQNMLWFRMFFFKSSDGNYHLTDEKIRDNTPNEQVAYHQREFDPDFDPDDPEKSERQIQEYLQKIKFGLS